MEHLWGNTKIPSGSEYQRKSDTLFIIMRDYTYQCEEKNNSLGGRQAFLPMETE